MGACSAGATPRVDIQVPSLVWIGLDLLASHVLSEITRYAPWIMGAFSAVLYDTTQLCALNPDVPEEITVQDVVGVVLDPIVGPIIPTSFYEKVWAKVRYAAFQLYCKCNQVPPVGLCVPRQFPFNSSNVAPATAGNNTILCWPATGVGHVAPIPMDPGCPTFEFKIEPRYGVMAFMSYFCGGQPGSSNAVLIGTQQPSNGSPFVLTLPGPICDPSSATGATLWVEFSTQGTGGLPNNTIVITPTTPVTPPTPPDPPPDTTGPVPTAPPLKCDSATVCAINWATWTRIQNIVNITNPTNTYVQTALPTSYVTGQTYTVTGQGVQITAQDILGVVVQFVDVPPNLVVLQTDPPRYYDVGWIAFGAGDAVDGKRWLHSSGDRFIPVFPEVDRVHYNLNTGVTVQLVELLAPPPPA